MVTPLSVEETSHCDAIVSRLLYKIYKRDRKFYPGMIDFRKGKNVIHLLIRPIMIRLAIRLSSLIKHIELILFWESWD